MVVCVPSHAATTMMSALAAWSVIDYLENSVRDLQTFHGLESAESRTASVAFGPKGTVLYSSHLLQKLIEYDHEQDRVLRNISMQCCATALDVSLCGSVVAFADANGSVGLLQYQEGNVILEQGMTSWHKPQHILCRCAE